MAVRHGWRDQAHRPAPVEPVRPIEVLGFLLSLLAIFVGLVLVLATGSYPS